VILKSDVEFDHFLWLEADPSVQTYELEPEPLVLAVKDDVVRTRFDALVHLHDARPQLREVKVTEDRLDLREQRQREAQAIAAQAAGFDYVRITREDLARHRQLIANWSCALAFIAACRHLGLDAFSQELDTLIPANRRMTLEQVLQGTDPALRSIYLAALFRSIRDRRLLSNLDAAPLCEQSLIWLPDRAHAH
jgi:hypothetical protein